VNTQVSDFRNRTAADVATTSRRRLLALLAALPAALGAGFGLLAAQDSAEAKKKGKGKRKNKNKNKNKNKGGGGGGGGYAPDSEERAFLDLINAYRRKNGAGNLS